MSPDLSRRSLMTGICSTALLPVAVPAATKTAKWTPGAGMPKEGPTTPKLVAPINGREITDQSMRRVKQLGVDHVLKCGPRVPWRGEALRG